jgi:2-hydroxychromene-2-carboxylate isomerase
VGTVAPSPIPGATVPRAFAVTFDYRCPFARNAHEAVVAALREGRDWDVRFAPFSLDQVHVAEGEPAVWERPAEERGSGVRALEFGIVVRDRFAERFLDFHVAAFAARHDHAKRYRDPGVLEDVARGVGLDPAAIEAEIEAGWPLKALAAEHSELVDRWAVFGVPTFIDETLPAGSQATFVRFMERGRVDDLEQALDLLASDRINEFKRTQIPR